MKRLGIYFFYDKDGIVDDYVPYYLSKLKPFCKELCVVVNKPLSKSGEQKLYAVTDKLIIRDNIGFDSCAYKEAIESYGYDTLKLYDELILCNFTCYGPVFPFSEMFSKMEKSDCDFWGISRYPRIENKRICDQQETDYVPEHIMSFFMGIRKKMLSSRTFKKYWDNLKVATNYAEAVAFNELLFTPYFEKHGFKSDTFISPELNKKFRENGATFTPCDFLKVRCPIVKRRAFFTDYSLFLYFENGLQSRTALDYIAKYTDYNVNLIWDNLIRTQPGSVLKRNLHLNYFLNEDLFYGNEENLKESLKTALLCYIYYPDMIDYCLSYAKNLPSWVDIYIFTVDPQVSEKVGETFAALPNRVTVRCKENRGQLASAVLISGKDIFEKYDLVCITQAKKSSQLVDRFSSELFCNHCWDGVLKSKSYVLNVIQSFYENPRMGYCCTMPAHWGDFKSLVGQEINCNLDNMKNLLNRLKIKVPFDDEPIASYGECYWVRAKGYRNLLKYPWSHEDFPPAAQTPKDGCILNALERLMPLIVQSEGYYPAWVMPHSMASAYLDNIYYFYRQKCQQEYMSIPINSNKTIPLFDYPILLKDIYQRRKLQFKLYKYTALGFLTFGKCKKEYTRKKNIIKDRLKKARKYAKQIIKDIL